MIPKILGLFLSVGWLQGVYGAAYSKYYVQNGAEIIPVEYVNYGAPRVVTNRQIAAISAPPIGSALPLPNLVSPCVAPCIVPAQTVNTIAAVPSKAKIISYNAPSLPAVVVPSSDEKTSYEYSYVVYDEDTGDRKAQRELSDGSVVHGEYSFIQPDGYVREVKYTADDLTGFNAVVKSFLPESVFGIEKKPETKDKNEPPPCKDPKSEALKVEPEHGHEEHAVPSHSESHESIPESHHVEAHGELAVVPVGHEVLTGHIHVVEDPPAHVAEHVPAHAEPSVEHSAEHIPEHSVHEHEHAPEHAPEHTHDHSPHAEEPQPESLIVHVSETPEEHAKHGEHSDVKVAVHPVEHVEHPPEHPHVEHTAEHHVEPEQPSAVEIIHPANNEDCGEKVQTHEAVQATPQASVPSALSAYNDIIRCLQAKLAGKDGNVPNISPLTYIILPGANKPC